MSSNQKEVNAVTLLEEDDEFEVSLLIDDTHTYLGNIHVIHDLFVSEQHLQEFENTSWEEVEAEAEEEQLWQDDWDDDDTNDDFTEQLRKQFEDNAEKS